MPLELYDNTRLTDGRKCLRYYYFRHIRDWLTIHPRVPLIYGLSWHDAMDVIWITLNDNPSIKTKDLVPLAMQAFRATWIENGLPDMEEIIGWSADHVKEQLKFRTPMNAAEMLWAYIDQRRDFISQCELLDVEKPFAVPLDPDNSDLLYVGRLDKVVRTSRGQIAAIEHKTTSLGSKSGGISQNHIDSFNPNSQVDGYLHALRCDYGKKATAVFIDIALVNAATQDTFFLQPSKRDVSNLDAWLWEVFYYIRMLKDNKYMLLNFRGAEIEHGAYDKTVLQAFPKDTSRCFDFFTKCEYHDLCTSWSNPEEHEMPEGFKEEHWSPFDILGLEKLGLEAEDV